MAWSVEQLERELALVGVELGRIEGRLRGADAGTWCSLAADRFRDRLGDLARAVGGVAGRVEEASALAAVHRAEYEAAPVGPAGPVPPRPGAGRW